MKVFLMAVAAYASLMVLILYLSIFSISAKFGAALLAKVSHTDDVAEVEPIPELDKI